MDMHSAKRSAWLGVIYPESAPADLWKQIEDTHLPTSVSPLHDCDRDEAGNLKKPHYHVICKWSGPTTFNLAYDTMHGFGCPRIQPCLSLFGSYRYHCHLDSPDKYQYDITGIRNFNGFQIVLRNDASYRSSTTEAIITIIREYGVRSLAMLTDMISDLKPEYLGCLATNSRFFRDYMQSEIYTDNNHDLVNPGGISKLGSDWVDKNGVCIVLK